MTVIDQTIGLAEYLLHPPLGFCLPYLDYYGPYSGNNTISQWSETAGPVFTPRSVATTFGVIVNLSGALPEEWGSTQGWVSELGELDTSRYFPPLGQLTTVHQLGAGAHVVTQLELIDWVPRLVMWSEALPSSIGLLVAPHIELDLQFLLLNPGHVWP
jgi:hypothetical protein